MLPVLTRVYTGMADYVDDIASGTDDEGDSRDSSEHLPGEFDDFIDDGSGNTDQYALLSVSSDSSDGQPARKRSRLDKRLGLPEDSDTTGPVHDAAGSVPVAMCVEERAAGDEAGVYDTKGAFRMRHTKSFLTYSKASGLSKEKLVTFYQTMSTKRFGIFEEKHADGVPHFHVVIDWAKQTNFKNPRVLDCCGVHPNIKKAHSNSWIYCVQPVKDKEVDPEPFLQGITVGEILAGDKWVHLMSLETEREFTAQALKVAGRDYALNRDRLLANWRAHRRSLLGVPERVVPFGPYPERFYLLRDDGETMVGAGDVDGIPKAWMPDSHSALLHGAAGLGKTSFAVYFMRHCTGKEPFIVTGDLNCLKNRNWNGVDPLIFDDMFFAGEKTDAQISNTLTTVFEPRDVRVLYGTLHIPAGVPRIFISNYAHPFKNAGGSVYGRRVQSFAL